MPFYFRKSVSAGPFRFNFSNGGMGISVGVKGFRVGTGPRGHYVHAGRGGLYYRASIPGRQQAGTGAIKSTSTEARPTSWASQSEPSVQMFRVSSADVSEMHDSRFADLLAELNAKQNAPSMLMILAGLGAGICLFALVGFGASVLPVALIVAGAMSALGAWLDTFQRSAVFMYHLEDDAKSAYEAAISAFDALAGSAAKWHIDAGGAVIDPHARKRNSGASHIVDKRPTIFAYALPRALKCNITPPSIQVGKETIYFLPDVALVVEQNKIGAVGYDALVVNWQDSNFVEDGNVPHDTTVIGYTWKYPNKNGGPDRRFADNRQLPICLYESIHLTSPNGLNELLQVSKSGLARPFAKALKALGVANGSDESNLALPLL